MRTWAWCWERWIAPVRCVHLLPLYFQREWFRDTSHLTTTNLSVFFHTATMTTNNKLFRQNYFVITNFLSSIVTYPKNHSIKASTGEQQTSLALKVCIANVGIRIRSHLQQQHKFFSLSLQLLKLVAWLPIDIVVLWIVTLITVQPISNNIISYRQVRTSA